MVEALDTIQIVNDLFAMVAFSSMMIKSTLSEFKDWKDKKPWNWSRFLLNLTFISAFFTYLIRVLYYNFGFDPLGADSAIPLVTDSFYTISVTTILSTFMIIWAVIFAFYILHWDYMMYFPVIYYVLALLFYKYSGDLTHHYIMFIFGAIMGLSTLVYIGFGMKENTAMTLAIVFTILFVKNLFFNDFSAILYIGWGILILLSFDKFNIYKHHELDEETEEED